MEQSMRNIVAGGMLVLDCDGTILPEVEKVHGLCVARVVEKASHAAGIGYSQHFFDALWHQELGKGIHNFFAEYVKSLEQESGEEATFFLQKIESLDNAERLYEKEYIEFSRQPENGHFFQMRKGLMEIFRQAVNDNHPVAVLSNANEVVLRASLTAGMIQSGEAVPDLSRIFTAIVGKDMVLRDGNSPKPHPSAVKSVQARIEEKIGRLISLPNSIGFGDTVADYNSFKGAGIGRVIACDNTLRETDEMTKPDEEGFIVVAPHHDVRDAFRLYQKNPSLLHHIPHHDYNGRHLLIPKIAF